ncbi:hypothetical protein ACGFNP_34240 [Nonomuraea sp. NPDC049269]|uniref:hypothetical protein n=1 Tax=Nonomuraea sp. NPDC049269 TaxID=3364349 RepID=UPI003717EE91
MLDPSSFRRKVTRADRFLEATGEQRFAEMGCPAMLYRCGPAGLLHPPLLRGSRGSRGSPVALSTGRGIPLGCRQAMFARASLEWLLPEK